jgi:isopenicillin N synthase-like dioxygenase
MFSQFNRGMVAGGKLLVESVSRVGAALSPSPSAPLSILSRSSVSASSNTLHHTPFNMLSHAPLASHTKTHSYRYSMPSTKPKRLSRVAVSEPAEGLPEIDFAASQKDFNQQAFAALKKKSGFVLHNLPSDFSVAAKDLWHAYDDFRAQPADTIAKFAGDASNIHGYHPDGSFLFGSRIGPRFFIGRDKNKIVSHDLPKPQNKPVSMRSADDKLSTYTDTILKKVVSVLEGGLNLPAGKFSAVFEGYETKTSLNHNLPVTREKLKTWAEKKKLTMTEDGRVESFLGHQDLVPLSILLYRNNEADGLEVEYPNSVGVRTYHPVKLNGDKKSNAIRAVVILGRATEILTDGLLEGSPHRVVAAPLKSGEAFSRDSINIFIFVDPLLPLKPLLTAPNGPKFEPISMPDFYAKYSKIYTEAAEKASVKELPASVSDAFPADNEIVPEQTSSGPVYRRR